MSNEQEFSVVEIDAILKSCRRNRVDRLQVGKFSVSFLPRRPKAEPVATPKEQIEAIQEYQNEVFKDNETRIRLEELSHLRLTDPEKYEELITTGELEDAGQEPS